MAVVSRKVAWGLVAAAAGVGVAVGGPPAPPATVPVVEPARPVPQPADPIRAADPLGAMLADANAAYAKVRDYACVFTRQERVNGALGAEQVAEMKVRAKPYSLWVKFARPEAVAGLEESYVAGSRSGKMRYRPAGASSRVRLVSLDDPKVLAETRHPLTELGVGATIDRLAGIAAREKALNNALEVFAADFQFAGRNVTRYELYARRPHAHRYAYRMLVFVDKETKLPVRFEAYDAPKPGTTVGDLLEAYSYTNVRLNVGLGDSAFE
jgi:hypothetical protein